MVNTALMWNSHPLVSLLTECQTLCVRPCAVCIRLEREVSTSSSRWSFLWRKFGIDGGPCAGLRGERTIMMFSAAQWPYLCSVWRRSQKRRAAAQVEASRNEYLVSQEGWWQSELTALKGSANYEPCINPQPPPFSFYLLFSKEMSEDSFRSVASCHQSPNPCFWAAFWNHFMAPPKRRNTAS